MSKNYISVLAIRDVDPEWFISDPTPDPDPTFNEVLAPTPDPDPISYPLTLVSALKELRGKLAVFVKIRRYIKFLENDLM